MKKITLIFVISALVIILGYDLFAVLHGGIQATISSLIWNSSLKYPIIPFSIGFLACHLVTA